MRRKNINKIDSFDKMESVFVYLVEVRDGTIYTGITNNLERRMAQHRGSLKGGAKYVLRKGFNRLLGFKKYPNRSEAMKEENRIKRQLTHAEKRQLLFEDGWIRQ